MSATIESITIECIDCGKDHTLRIYDIPCPHYVASLEKSEDRLRAEVDRLTDELDDLKASIRNLRTNFETTAPATPQA